jgi:hypothetical protein
MECLMYVQCGQCDCGVLSVFVAVCLWYIYIKIVLFVWFLFGVCCSLSGTSSGICWVYCICNVCRFVGCSARYIYHSQFLTFGISIIYSRNEHIYIKKEKLEISDSMVGYIDSLCVLTDWLWLNSCLVVYVSILSIYVSNVLIVLMAE